MQQLPSFHGVRFHTIVSHRRPDADEVLADMLLRRYAEPIMPGIGKARRVFVEAGTDAYEGYNGFAALKAGIVSLGVCGGPFDEHPRDGKPGKEESAALLVFEFLNEQGLIPEIERFSWQPIVNRVDEKDTGKAGSVLLDMFRTMDNLYRLRGEAGTESAIIVAKLVMESQFEVNLEVYTSAKREFDRGTFEHLKLSSGKELKLAVVESDHELILQYAMTATSGRPTILIHRKPLTGNVQIHCNKMQMERKDLSLDPVVALIRREEAKVSGAPITDKNLEADGKVEGAECWYYQRPAMRLLNGSLKAQVEPTRLSLPHIVRLVKEGMGVASPASEVALAS